MQTATDFHSIIANDFNDKYKTNPDFIERFNTWSGILDNIILPNMQILDAGCGSGVFSFYLASKGCSVIGIDGSDKMIELCERIKSQNSINNIEFHHGFLPLSNIPANWNNRDVIISSSVLEYIENTTDVLNNFKSLLKNDGILVISMPNAESIYRRIERTIFKLFKRPAYYAYVKHVTTLNDFNNLLKTHGFLYQSHIYYATNDKISRILKSFFPLTMTSNLFVGVYKLSK